MRLQAQAIQENSGRRKTSKYFATAADADTSSKQKVKDEAKTKRAPARKSSEVFADEDDDEVKPSPAKKLHKDEDDDFVLPNEKKKTTPVKPAKKLKNAAGVGVAKHSVDDEDDNEEDELAHEDVETPVKAGGRGKGGRGSGVAAGGRGRGGGRGGRGGFMNFGERKDPPHKGEKVNLKDLYCIAIKSSEVLIYIPYAFSQEVPEGAPDCLSGLTFVISGTLDRYFKSIPYVALLKTLLVSVLRLNFLLMICCYFSSSLSASDLVFENSTQPF